MGQCTSIYLDDDLHAAVKASGVPLAELIRRGLTAGAGTASADRQTREPLTDSAPLSAIGQSEPGHGAVCAGPGCWQRNTAIFGLRRLPLCPACAAALEGRTYQREVPESAARAVRRGAA